MSGLQIDTITKSFGATEVLKGVSLEIGAGEFVSLVGPSGCGKSTLLRIVAGLEQATAGDIRIGGRSVAGIRAADRNLSMVFQSYALYPHLSVADNIAVPLRMRQLGGWHRLPLIGGLMPGARDRRAAIRQAVAAAADTLEISALLDRKPGQLSGGQRQRVALGRALVREPAAFLLDEPLSNLDAKLRVQTRAEIAQLHRRLGTTFVYVTHDQVEAMTMSDRIAVMMDGRILQCASPDIVYNDPDDIRVAEFIGSPKINLLPAESDGAGRLSVFGHGLPLHGPAPNQVLQVGIRPERLIVGDADAPIAGHVAHLENLGSELFAQVRIAGFNHPVTLRAEPEMAPALHLGARIGLGFDPAHLLVFDAGGKRVRRLSPQAAPRRKETV
ncbi:MAG: ABC transporter ATP-binding protein [Paracoccaceae bacterium]